MNIELIDRLIVVAGVRYWEDAEVNGKSDEVGTFMPFISEDKEHWMPIIDFNSGKIIDWPIGTTAEVHYKVCDDGMYTLLDKENNVLKVHDGYVPDCLSPKDRGFGDYIIMDIDENGLIQNWKPTLKGF